MTITYIILTHGENQVFGLINFLKQHKDTEDKLWVLNDPTTEDYLTQLKKTNCYIINHKLDKDYSTHRNIAVNKVTTDYFFFLDADEELTERLMKNIKAILKEYKYPDLVWIPRVNIFKGVKPIHALMWNWTLTGEVCNYPDMQSRLAKSRKGISFCGKLHERLKTDPKIHKVIQLPINSELDILHRKSIETQITQNEYYNKEFSLEENSGQSTMNQL